MKIVTVQIRKCHNCRFWSEMVARSIGLGPIESLCLNPKSSNYSKYVDMISTCSEWKSGHFGAIDSPHYGEQVRDAYDIEDEL